MNNRRSFTYSTNDTFSINAREQGFEIGIMLRIIPYDRILNANASSVIDKAGDASRPASFYLSQN
jgi:hypothetical protein